MENHLKNQTCCFFGHRKIVNTPLLAENVKDSIKNLIVNYHISNFLFGSNSEFNDLCYKTVSELKKIYTKINRIYVRAQFPDIDVSYKNYLLEYYEDTYYHQHMRNAGKAAYVERNFDMIDNSCFCIIYYDKNYAPPLKKSGLMSQRPKSGTEIAYLYAVKKKLVIKNLFV